MKLSTKPQKFHATPSGHGAKTARVGASRQSEMDSFDGVYGRIALLAYQFYEQRGRVDGHDMEDWIRAEQTILAAK